MNNNKHYFIMSSFIFLELKNAEDKSCRETRNKNFMFNNTFSKNVSLMR